MNPIRSLRYVERASGVVREEPVFAGAFLFWSYNSRLGRLATDLLFSRKTISALYGAVQRTSWSRRRIAPFVRKLAIDLSDLAEPMSDFTNFEAFFTRRIDLARRPVEKSPDVCVSPCDCRVFVRPSIRSSETFEIKRGLFNLSTLIDDPKLALEFDGGSLFVGRLYLSDYHHFHFPLDCIPAWPISIPGRFYAVSPYSQSRSVPIYLNNHRMVTVLSSTTFGKIVMVEIGAFTVGSIRQTYVGGKPVEKATHKGLFGLGASTVALVFQPGRIQFDDDLIANSSNDLETYVRLGESIGCSLGRD